MGHILNKIITSSDNNLETFSLLWLDASVNKTDDNRRTQEELRVAINQLIPFEDPNECIKYISSMRKEDRIVLIVSGSLGRQIVPRIHHLEQFSSIYIYCQDQNANEQWSAQYIKVKAVVTNLKELIARIQFDQEKRQQSRIYEALPISIFDPKIIHGKLTTDLHGKLVQSQLLINCLLRMRSNVSDRNELIFISKQIYKKSPTELALINEFQNRYSPADAIRWYTRDSFLFRLLNKALRTQNIDILFLFQFFIVDIRRQLEQLRSTIPIKAYRSQLMSNDELQKLRTSIGQFISINSFLSATLDPSRAMFYFENTDDSEHILFEIYADPRLNSGKPFADIRLCHHKKEEEILFMLGSIFEIISVDQNNRHIWIVRLQLCSDNNQQFDSMNDENKLLSFGHVLMTMGKVEEAEIYYRRLLEDLESSSHPDLARCYEALAAVADEKGDYGASIHLYEKSLNINLAGSNGQFSDIASNYNSLGELYRKKQNYQKALEYHKKALDTLGEKPSDENLAKQAVYYNNIGIVLQEQQKYHEALDFYVKAYDIRKKYFSSDGTSLGMSYNNIGNAYYFLKQYDNALQFYREALKIYKKTLPPQHPKYASTCNNIGAIYDDQGKFDEAVIYYTDAAKIYRNIYPSAHPNMIKIEENIQRTLLKAKK